MKINPKDYRPNVGMMIINQNKEIFVGKRIDHPSEFWQMPQGGIDPKEKSEVAALREMEEEVGIKKNKVKLISQSKDCCLLYTSPSPRDKHRSRMPSSA